MTRNERRKKAIESEQQRYADEIKAVWKKAEEEDRETTPEERGDVEEKLKAIETLKGELEDVNASIDVEKKVHDVSRTMGEATPSPGLEFHDSVTLGQNVRAKTLGEMFVASEGYKAVQARGFTGEWTTGAMEFGTKGTLLEGSGSPGSGTGGAFLTVPQVIPGVTTKLFQRLTVADLLASGQTSGNTLRYIVEGTATSAAAGVAEAGAKPESTLGLSTVDEPVKKIATTLTVSDEMLEDEAQVQSYINSRLSLFVQIEEERQIVRGAGTNELVGLMAATRGINIYAGGTAAGNKAVQAFKAMNGTRGSSFLEPSGWVIHPTDWQDIRLLTDTAGQFFGGGPFMGPYGNGTDMQQSGQVNGVVDYLWGKPVVVTTALGGAGTALCGAFETGAQLWRREGITVEATNSHASYFDNNLERIRAEERLGLAVYRPNAFTEIRLA